MRNSGQLMRSTWRTITTPTTIPTSAPAAWVTECAADLAANNGGWQWSASTGTDAAPYFRVFNPTLQGKTYETAIPADQEPPLGYRDND